MLQISASIELYFYHNESSSKSVYRATLQSSSERLTLDFTLKDRNLIQHMDEIHVSSTIASTGGRIVGYST